MRARVEKKVHLELEQVVCQGHNLMNYGVHYDGVSNQKKYQKVCHM